MASPQAEFSPSSSNRKLILAGQIAFLPTGILTTLLGPMLPILIARWAMNDTQAGNLFLVQFLASLVGVQLAGVLLTRWGFRPAFLLGLLLMACGVATLYMGSLALGLASVAAYGLGLGLIIPTNNLLIAEIGSRASAGLSSGDSSGDSSSDSSKASSRASSSASAVSLLNFFWGVGAVLCSVMVAWTAAHRLLPFFLGAVALFLVLLALAMRRLPFPAAAKSSVARSSEIEIRGGEIRGIVGFIFMARAGQESGDLAFRRRLLSLSGSGNGGGRMDRLLCLAAGIARGGDGVHDAGVFLVGADGGPGVRNRVSTSLFGAPRFAGRLCRGSGGHRADALGSGAVGSDCRSADYGTEFLDVVSDHRRPVFRALRSCRSQHWRGHVFARGGRAGGYSLDGGRDLSCHRESARWTAAAAGGYGDPVSPPPF